MSQKIKHADVLAVEFMEDQLQAIRVFVEHTLDLLDIYQTGPVLDHAMHAVGAHYKAALETLADLKSRRVA